MGPPLAAGYVRCQPLRNHRRATEIRCCTFDSERTYRWIRFSASRSASVNRSCWRRCSAPGDQPARSEMEGLLNELS
jgi:hypothetical protein